MTVLEINLEKSDITPAGGHDLNESAEEKLLAILVEEMNGEVDLSQASVGRFEYNKLDGITARVHLD